jgi:hypothetical protein
MPGNGGSHLFLCTNWRDRSLRLFQLAGEVTRALAGE